MEQIRGRAKVVTRRAGVHLFGTLSTDGTAINYRTPTVVLPHRIPSGGCELSEHEERLFVVSSSVREVIRQQIGTPVPPLTNTELQTAANVSRRSLHRLRIAANGSDESEIYEIDLGQPIEFYANNFQVEIVSPVGVEIIPDAGSSDTAEGTIYDSQIWVKGLEVTETVGATEASLTDVVPVAAGVAANIPVPSHARSLMIAMTLAGSYPPEMAWYRGNPTIGVPGAIELGRLPWEATGQRRTAQFDDLMSASHIQIGPDVAAARLFTFQWGIRP